MFGGPGKSRLTLIAVGSAAVLLLACREAGAGSPAGQSVTLVTTAAPVEQVLATVTPTPPAGDIAGLATATQPACYDRGYAGMVRDPEDPDGKLYFLVEPPEDPADAAKAVAETLCVLGGRYVPQGKVRVEKADYTLKELDAWYEQLRGFVWLVDGVYSSGRDEGANRIEYRVLTERQRDAVYEQVVKSGVPREAVVVDVREPLELDDPPVNPVSEIGIAVSLAVESQSATTTTFGVVLANVSGRSVEVEHGHPPDIDVGVFTAGGRELWRHQPPVIAGTGKSTQLAPGDSVSFPVVWDRFDLDGERVEAGEYLARGFALVDLATAPIEFRIEAREGQ